MELDCEGKVFGSITVDFHETEDRKYSDKEVDEICDAMQEVVEKIEGLLRGNLAEEVEVADPSLTAWVRM